MMFTSVALTLVLAPLMQGPSAKDLFDRHLRAVRASQQQDGSYGAPTETAHVLTAMALCPRSYQVEDGPFVQDALNYLLSQDPQRLDREAQLATALALQSLDATRFADRIALLAAATEEHPAVPLTGLAGLAQGDWSSLSGPPWPAWAAELPLPNQADATAVGTMMAISERPIFGQLVEDLACAGLLYRKEKRAKQPTTLPDSGASYERGVDFLLEQRGESGLWEVFGQPEPGISALAARALLGSNRKQAREAAIVVLDYLVGIQQQDGSIHAGNLPVYVTSVAVSALARGGREQDRPVIDNAVKYLTVVQTDGGEGYSEADKFYGGIGYGNDLRPDLSNLQYALQAMHDAGKKDDPAFQRALFFLQRSQNRSESNPEVFTDPETGKPIRSGNDGGGVYYPGNSPAGTYKLADGSLVMRSYGSMTYALLKCYLFAGLDLGDARVKAVVDWIAKHWTLEVNPGFDTLRDPRGGFQGLYYYYLSLAEALDVAGLETIETPSGSQHHWRAEVIAKLNELQRKDGSWLNEQASRWWEGNPVLCTAYALSALEVSRKR